MPGKLALLLALGLAGCGLGPRVPSVSPIVGPEASFSPSQTFDDPRVADASIAAVDQAAWDAFAARPLRLPTLSTEAACPLATPAKISEGLGPAVGEGPIFAVSFAGSPVVSLGELTRYADGYYRLKVLWVVTDSYTAPALVRGGRIDRPGEVRFNDGDAALRLSMRSFVFSPGVPRTWRQFPSHTDVKEPGCYAWQVDGTTFTETIAFAVVR
jgi:hypothetical protein